MEKYEPLYESCPICGSTQINEYQHDFRGNYIHKCNKCAVQFMNPVYSDEYLSDYYSNYYDGADESVQQQKSIIAQRRDNRAKMQILGKYITPPGNVFDFGCGNGNFLSFTKASGWEGEGFDVDCEATQLVSRRLESKIYCGDFMDADIPDASFDLIHANHVIEHLKDPVKNLKKLYKLLKPGGYFYVAVPNISAYSARLKFFLEKIGLRKKNIGKYYDTEHHVFYYTPKSMRNLLESTGFRVHMSINSSKAEMPENKGFKLIFYYLRAKLYSGSSFLVIASKEKT